MEQETEIKARKKQINEKRRHKRFKAREGAYAAISPSSHKLGQIVNISLGGLVFKYIDKETREQGETKEEQGEKTEDRLFLGSGGQFVDNIPFKTIEEIEISESPSFSFLKMKMKRVEFKELDFDQIFQIENFIRNNMVNNQNKAEFIISVDE